MDDLKKQGSSTKCKLINNNLRQLLALHIIACCYYNNSNAYYVFPLVIILSMRLYKVITFVLMGACIGKDKRPEIGLQKRKSISKILYEVQISILQLIFNDLSDRIEQGKINHQNFLLFFHKNGYWGSRLFKEFDYDKTKLISREQFIMGIAKIFKSSEAQKISLLYKFFSNNDKKDQEGVYFDKFLIMLYNYPKEDLKEILDDKQFFEIELKKKLVEVQSQRKINQYKVYRLQSGYSKQQQSQRQIQPTYQSLISKQICKNIQEKYNIHNQSNTLNFHHGDQIIQVRTSSIQRLVKRFATRIFNQSKIDVKFGKLNFQQFHKWICTHKRLYQNYYDGFHNKIWQIDLQTKKPKYLSIKCEKTSQANVVSSSSSIVKVILFLYHSILVVCQQIQLQRPLQVVCLEGLAVKRIYENNYGIGFSIKHRDDFYGEKKIFIKNQALLQQWMEHLKFYNGQSIQQKYEIGEKIGTGKFSIVYRCKNVLDNKQYALKEIATYKLDAQAKRLISHESNIMKVISHPLLLQFKQSIQTKTHVYIVTQLVKGRDLFDFVKQYKYLEEYQVAQIAVQLIIGIRFLHSFDIVHRDLKPQNIMVVFDEKTKQISYIKIIDFGFSNYLSKLSKKKPQELLTGTPNYIAPEILKEEGISLKIDNFSIGSIIYFMVTGKLAFNDDSITGILVKTMRGQYTHNPKRKLSRQCIDLIDQLLKVNPLQRITLQEALRHPWLKILKQQKKNKRSA